MTRLIAIGGGDIYKNETKVIDQYIVSLVEKEVRQLLFIPTASNDDRSYTKQIRTIYTPLGCKVKPLLLLNKEINIKRVEKQIMSSDIIYIGGGNTKLLIDTLKAHNIDEILKRAYQAGIVLVGISAGANCFFKYGYDDIDGKKYDFIEGFNFIKNYFCPHYDEPKFSSADKLLLSLEQEAIVLENRVALAVIDGKFSLIKDDENKKAYKFVKAKNMINRQEL